MITTIIDKEGKLVLNIDCVIIIKAIMIKDEERPLTITMAHRFILLHKNLLRELKIRGLYI